MKSSVHRGFRQAGAVTVWAVCLLCMMVGGVQAEQGDELWASLFGEGMHSWAEGDYDRALDMLYQSNALRPTSYNLSLIVRSHDFLGECDAASRQLEEYRALYGKAKAPTMQTCATSGKLVVECPASQAGLKVLVSGRVLGESDKVITLPAGTHEVKVPALGYSAIVRINASETHRHVVKVTTAQPSVSKLISTADRYTTFMTPDGLYQIWVLNDAHELLHPYEGSLCTRSDREASCKPLTKTQRDELEKVAPMILLLPD